MIVIVDYGMGNLGSILNIVKKVGGEAMVSSDPKVIAKAEKLILPGVGAFDQGMLNLERRGLIEVLNKKVLKENTPILGICLGLQLFTKKSEEGKSRGLGWVDAETVRFKTEGLKIPHMGWDYIKVKKDSPLTKELPENPRFYFVHSYHLVCKDKKDVLATTEYGYEFVSAIQHNNIFGTQFHPEKSHKFGMVVMKNFVENV